MAKFKITIEVKDQVCIRSEIKNFTPIGEMNNNEEQYAKDLECVAVYLDSFAVGLRISNEVILDNSTQK
jgi:hypothetical protein